METASTQATADTSAAYDTFDDFLRLVIKEQYQRRGLRNPNFVALLLASGQIAQVAKTAVGSADGLKRLALGTMGLVAARAILLRVISGPIGLVLTGVSVASLIALLVRHHREIFKKTDQFRSLIQQTRERFEEAQLGYRQNRMGLHERNLMVDGLMNGFLRQCDEI